jgi:acyl carrier protein
MLFDQVRDIIVETISCDAEEVTREASLTDDLGADSLDAVEINMALEDAFDIKIPDEKLDQMKTVGDVVDCVESMVDEG